MKKIVGLSFIFLLIDQIIKFIVTSNMFFTESINIINNFFRITYLRNNGAAFSILSGNIIFLVVITIIALLLIYFFLIKNNKLKKIDILNYSLLLGGIIGNLIDRVRLGYVIDYLDFNFGSYNYPVFNFADICIVLSIILIILKTIKEGDKDGNSSRYR